MRLNATRLGSIASSRSFGDQLDDLAGQVPSLDLNFAQNKSLIDDYSGTTLVTHTRASSGTYVDSEGVIRTAVTNLLLRSEEFDNAAWGKVGGSITTNAITAPNGQATADLFTEDTSTGQHDVRVTSPTLTDGATYTFSVYSKANGRRLNITYPLVTAGHGAVFNLNDGTFTLVGDTVSASILLVGDGWYRCSCTATKSGGTSSSSLRFLTHDGTTKSYTGDGTSGIYLWGAQLEQSATVGEYIPTTSTINSAPRFDHNPTTGESLGLLVEEARTNLILQSENLSTTWTNVNTSEAINVATAPDGTTTADKLITNNGVASVSSYITQTVAKSAAATTYTYSVFAKTGDTGTGTVQLLAVDTASSANSATSGFSTVSGTIAIAASVNGTFTNASSIITPLADGWYRCSLTFTTGTETSINLRLYSRLPTTGNGSSGLLLWGVQLETGAFPTSYIPTTTATVTRAADVASITGANFSSWYRQDEGTVFVNGITPPNRANFPSLNTLHDGTSNNRLLQYVFTSGYFSAARVGSVPQGDNTAAVTPTDGSAYKVASAFAVNNSVTAVNGVTGSVDTLCLMPTALNTLAIGAEWNNANIVNSTIRRLTYWPTRLGNEVLQRITQ